MGLGYNIGMMEKFLTVFRILGETDTEYLKVGKRVCKGYLGMHQLYNVCYRYHP